MHRWLFLIAVGLALPAWADGGLVRLSQTSGPFRITVFSAPTPLRAGPIDLSVLVQRLVDDAPVLDASASIALRAAADPTRVVTAVATHEQATNKLLYAAAMIVPAPGRWQVEVTIDDTRVAFDIDAAPPAPDAVTFWPYLALPFLALALFGVHQWLVLKTVDQRDPKRPQHRE